ncbi:MAG: hypothetical protein Q7V20_04825 [Aquabacterium sp.]|uniref:hypothetical protein n=1 Tax=Aquabacterium sp. TaxID=1872578 RepID=UPI00272812A9|nr:hypothetical protein [Aquabacterium sp.]MDO9002762.1 hypothetical protein [Aquabacterium sp.]
MERILASLKGTLDKSFLTDLRAFLSIHKNESQFAIFSDYCIDAKNKFNNVASFTIAPSWAATPKIVELLAEKIPKDIKKTKCIDRDIIEALSNRTFFHVTFILKSTAGVLYSKGHTDQHVALLNMDSVTEMIKMWIINQPEGKEKFEEQIKRFSIAKSELSKKSANMKLFKLISVVAMLAAYLAFLLSKEAKCKSIVWFSDRDKIIDAFGEICRELFEINHYGLCLKEMAEMEISKVGYGIDDAGIDRLWFDSLIRLPDYMAGTIASWDMNENLVSSPKHSELLRRVFAQNPFCVLISATIGRSNFSFSRIDVSKAHFGV